MGALGLDDICACDSTKFRGWHLTNQEILCSRWPTAVPPALKEQAERRSNYLYIWGNVYVIKTVHCSNAKKGTLACSAFLPLTYNFTTSVLPSWSLLACISLLIKGFKFAFSQTHPKNKIEEIELYTIYMDTKMQTLIEVGMVVLRCCHIMTLVSTLGHDLSCAASLSS